MISLIKFSISFTISYIILSIPISGKTLFSRLYNKTGDLTSPIFYKLKDATAIGVKKGAQFFLDDGLDNNYDKVTTKKSGIKRSRKQTPNKNPHKESYTKQEQAFLENIMKGK